MKEPKQRTIRQNSALHKGFQLIADQLKEKGYSVQQVLEGGIELEWTPELVKSVLFKPIAALMFEKQSSTQLTTKELQETWENMSRAIAKTGASIPFPSEEPPLFNPLPNEN